MNEQVFSLQNKFYVQSKILNDKNIELSKEVWEKQKIKVENEKVTKESLELKKKIELITKEKDKLSFQNEKYKKDINELNQKYNVKIKVFNRSIRRTKFFINKWK